jgi:hypothetical protein
MQPATDGYCSILSDYIMSGDACQECLFGAWEAAGQLSRHTLALKLNISLTVAMAVQDDF